MAHAAPVAMPPRAIAPPAANCNLVTKNPASLNR